MKYVLYSFRLGETTFGNTLNLIKEVVVSYIKDGKYFIRLGEEERSETF